ncbi:MAG: hypothetical protein R2932_17845 [Caldilineaceae bacterium]
MNADAHALIAALYPHTGQAHIIGVTGAPGSGKSTLVTALTQSYRRAGLTVAIVAIDPTSPFTGGAILGDRGACVRSAGTAASLCAAWRRRVAWGSCQNDRRCRHVARRGGLPAHHCRDGRRGPG